MELSHPCEERQVKPLFKEVTHDSSKMIDKFLIFYDIDFELFDWDTHMKVEGVFFLGTHLTCTY